MQEAHWTAQEDNNGGGGARGLAKGLQTFKAEKYIFKICEQVDYKFHIVKLSCHSYIWCYFFKQEVSISNPKSKKRDPQIYEGQNWAVETEKEIIKVKLTFSFKIKVL